MFHIKSQADYKKQYQLALDNPDKFWDEIANNYFWHEKWQKTSDCDLENAKICWFLGGKTNISYNCLDRHLETRSDKTAIVWESNDPNEESIKISYKELHAETCRIANLLSANGIKKGDRICFYMPMIWQAVAAMLACTRIGAIHSVVFAGFSASALASRIDDCGAKMLITADVLFRGDKTIDLFSIADEAIKKSSAIESVLLFQRGKEDVKSDNKINIINYQKEIAKHSTTHEAEALDAEDPSFILYTSGSTGTPKGIVHSTGGYMVYAGYSFKNVFQAEENDLFFCTADIGWITGHTYLTYGPLLNGTTILMFEGVPTYPDASRFWQIVEKHKVNILYTAPTAIRALMQKGDKFVDGHDLSSLKTLGSVGEPINEEAWQWYFDKIGNKKCAIVDTWWQTETGGILISTFAHVNESKPSYAGFPLPGIVPALLDNDKNEINEDEKLGSLCMKQAWPSMARGVWNNRKKFVETYYAEFPGYYLAGDGAFKEKGLFRIIGRNDDVIKVSGHRLGTAEIENATNQHELVTESAVIGAPHEIKGEGIHVFAITRQEIAESDQEKVTKEISKLIEKEIGAIARPEKIYIVSDLPKTRSGKIMRRILKKLVAGESDLGDISTLVNPETVEVLRNLVGSC